MRARRPLRARKRLNPINKERRATMSEVYYGSDEFSAWLHRLQCCIPGCEARDVEQAHVVSKGAGGDWTDTVPMCREHHREQHALGFLTFEKRHGVSLIDFAAAVQARWKEERGE